MRAPSWLIGSRTAFDAPPRPADQAPQLSARLSGLQRAARRRLSDRIEDLFEEACLSGDFDTAEALLAAFEVASRRTGADAVQHRQAAGDALAVMRRALERRRERAGGR